jgi:hypothetical protein
MYLEEISGKLQSHDVKIKYDCNGSFDTCGQEKILKLRYSEKNFKDNDGKHICRKCFLKNKNPMKKQEIKEKVKKTCKEKYGCLPINTQENIEKRKQLFKDENYKKQWVEKHKKTSMEKYGVEHPMHLESTKNKQKQTMQEKYGVDHPYQSPKIMEKMKENNLKKYGVENVAQLPEVQIKMAKTTFERYGVEHYNELSEMKDYLRENCREWLAESWANPWANPWAKGIVRPEEWNQKQRETIAELIANDEWAASYKNSKKGRYFSKKCNNSKNPMFRSNYELKVHIWLDNNENVDGYEYEPYIIPYYDTEGKKRYYFPDFLIKFGSQDVLLLLEVKNNYASNLAINISKDLAAKNFAKEKGMNYELWLDSKIESLLVDPNAVKERWELF